MAGTWTDLTASAIRYLLSSTTRNVSTNLVRKCCSWLLYFLLDYLSVKRVCVCVCNVSALFTTALVNHHV